MTLAPDLVPKLPRGVRLVEDAARGTFVLLAPERVVEVDDTAVEVLSRVDGARSVGAIVAALAAEFDAPAAEIAEDVAVLLADLHERRMLDWAGVPA